MREKHITRTSLHNRRRGLTDLTRLGSITDEEIERAVADDADAAPIDLDWSKAIPHDPQPKKPISIRLDEDVLAFFKARGGGYQRRINAVLRSYMQHSSSPEERPKPEKQTG